MTTPTLRPGAEESAESATDQAALPPVESTAESDIPDLTPDAHPSIADISALGDSANQLVNTAAAAHDREILLNKGCDRETTLKTGACELIDLSEQLQQAFESLRRNYPDKPFDEQCSGQEFRDNADLIMDALAEKTLRGLDPARVVVLMPWRAGLAFAQSYLKRGVRKFCHVGASRDEKTLKTHVDFELIRVEKGHTVIVADPMLATGNTFKKIFDRLEECAVKPEQVIVNSVVAAPVGVQSVKQCHPDIRVIAAALDDKLDHRGYIVPGLGDYGDKYYGNFTPQQLAQLCDDLHLDDFTRQKLFERFQKHQDQA